MQNLTNKDKAFLDKLVSIVMHHISNDQFGVSELADEAGMSRSNLLRKIKKLTNLSVSKFIADIRLKQAFEMLKEDTFSVSEVSYQVGYSSTSYFIKCFREQYGYPPGEVKKREEQKPPAIKVLSADRKRWKYITILATLVVIVIVLVVTLKSNPKQQKEIEKSIAVLPFKNESSDSSNVYLVNGLMESVLSNLQKIKDVKVVSRTSVEKYRNTSKTISEIAKELNVSYFVEGSGQKSGDQIMLSIQLIEASKDKHLWAKQYKRKVNDIFQLQLEVAKNIAHEIQAIITPEEKERIDKIPTENHEAYDLFLKGLDQFHKGTTKGLNEAISLFQKAIEQDGEFARAYADVAIAYYYLDVFQAKKQYSEQINTYADRALLFDSQLPQSLLAKAYYYMNIHEYKEALPYLEKALEYNPNSAVIINTLSDFYTNYIPNTGKYLEYALKGLQLNMAAQDSVTTSYLYLHLSNAFIQCGFVPEAEKYVNISLAYNPHNLYSEYLKAYVLLAKNKDFKSTKALLKKALAKDTTRLDILQEVGKICYYMREYPEAYKYYSQFLEAKKMYNLDVYRAEDAKIAVVASKLGLKYQSDSLLNAYYNYANADKSIYKNLSLSVYYSYKGETLKAIEQFNLFSQQENYQYWIVLFLHIDPLVDNIKDLPDYKSTFKQMEEKFNKKHSQIRATLSSQGLL